VTERSFLDTNILIYADDLDAGEKNTAALELLTASMRDGVAVLSTQVLQEYFVVATRKLGVDPVGARRRIELLAHADVVRIDVPDIFAAIDLHRLHSLSFWDALIVRAASVGGCARVLSEDMQHDAVIDGVRIENPFRS
jgi:predicted nucleic acid-binding protein